MLKLSKILIIFSWALLIFALLTKPQPESLYEFTIIDKVVHFFIFGILSYLVIWVFYDNKQSNFKVITFLAFLCSIIYSYFLEYLQQFIPGRYPDILDLLSGAFGSLLFLQLAYFKYKKPRLLLHICCAGCGIFVSQELRKKYDVTIYYYNPNIDTKDEWEKRLGVVKKIATNFKLKLIFENKYTHKAWLKKIKGLEKERERGKRCEICYKCRLEKAAKLAQKENFDCFTTTLTVSPHKNSKFINEIGNNLEKKYKVKFLAKDFKKHDGFKKSVMMSRGLSLYRQNYCGCEFSKRRVA